MAKLYTHYKNKPYKMLGQVRHSETLEELVLYEALYENKLGTMWVRPKDMFFGSLEVGGKSVKRFSELEITYEKTEQVTETHKTELLSCLDQLFGGYSKEKMDSVFLNRGRVLLVTARVNGELAGFKLGYAYDKDRFYSWLGGVSPRFRGGGIAQELMILQHNWCRENNFSVIETRTKNKWKSMLLLNIKNGFNIVGTYTNSKGETKIILEKRF